MSDLLFDGRDLSDGERSRLESFKADLDAAKAEILESVPEHVIALGGIIRKGIETGTIDSFRAFLEEHSISFEEDWLYDLRDLIIIQRFDLMELEPEARERLRHRTLAQDSSVAPSSDYLEACNTGSVPHCRDCRWFVKAPSDGDDKSELSCVQMGTKGADQACVGFKFKDSENLTV
jgi:hypothetical protein